MKNNFEDSVKNKLEQFNEIPSEKIWTDISQKISDTGNPKIHSWKKWAIAAVGVLILSAIMWIYFPEKNKDSYRVYEQLPIAQKIHSEGTGTSAAELFPIELKQCKSEGKALMAYVCMENCKFCTKFVNETLSLPEVNEYLENNFIQVAVDLRDKENHPFLNLHEIKAAPSVLFFDVDGNFLSKSMGAIPASEFMEIAGEAKAQ